MSIEQPPRCRDCREPAVAVDLDYDEGYCARHWTEQQRSSEPVTNYVLVNPDDQAS